MVVVTGIGLVSALGENLEVSWKNLIAGKSGIDLHQPFPELEPRPLAMIGKQPAQLKELTRLVVALALEDAGLVAPLPDCGVVIGSSRSFQADWEVMLRQMYGEQGNSSLLSERAGRPRPYVMPFIQVLPHMNAIATAQQIGATGIVLAPMAACATGIWALFQAAFLIETGQCHRVIAGAIEAPITPLTIAGFQQMGALAKTGAYPFDKNREGLVLGEGGAIFVLESKESAISRQAKIYGEILGFGLTADAHHPNSSESQGKSAEVAIKQCLERSKLTFRDIDCIHAHGTGTYLNDKFESLLIQRLFPKNIAVISTKGATGHTIGASGALSVAFSLLALQQKILPSSVGLSQPEFDLNIVTEARKAEIRQMMCFSFGFGGQNAVVALRNL
jgi:3-oxoacyl-[acyl-carrier-protein] synthase II